MALSNLPASRRCWAVAITCRSHVLGVFCAWPREVFPKRVGRRVSTEARLALLAGFMGLMILVKLNLMLQISDLIMGQLRLASMGAGKKMHLSRIINMIQKLRGAKVVGSVRRLPGAVGLEGG